MRICMYLLFLVFSINLNAVNLTELPTELHQLIASKLPIKTILAFCETSKKLKEVCDSDFFWQTMLKRDFAGQRPTGEDDSSVSAKERYKNYSELEIKNIALLKKNTWAKSEPVPGGFFVNADLSNLRLTAARRHLGIESSSRIRVVLSEANLTNANLSRTKFDGVTMDKAILVNANLSNAKWQKVALRHADLRNANLANAFFQNVNLFEANLTNANLHGATLITKNMKGANFSGVDLTDAAIQYYNPEKPGIAQRVKSIDDLKAAGAVWREENPPKGNLKYSK